jgi:hypothetical protein
MAPVRLPGRLPGVNDRCDFDWLFSLMPCPIYCLSRGAAPTHLGYSVRRSAEGLSSTYTRRGQADPCVSMAHLPSPQARVGGFRGLALSRMPR